MRTRLHTDSSDVNYVEQLPFSPFDITLRDSLRNDFIAPVATWLMGRHQTSLLSMEGNSAWETALTISSLLDAVDIFRENNERTDLIKQIEAKVIGASRWLLEKKSDHQKGESCWEHVTWDTSVIIDALMDVLTRYRTRFSPDEEGEIEATIVGATSWLYRRFEEWETRVKYPFGPADVAQVANTVLKMQVLFPNLLSRVEDQLKPKELYDLPLRVTQYLLRRRSFETLAIRSTESATVNTQGCWWDDYFSTAEVMEALGRFYGAALDQNKPEWKELLDEVRTCLVETCAFLETSQLDGMWGNHIDTARILRSYVMIRRLVPQVAQGRRDDTIIQPEIHITFKALRWLCDEKQVFDDGSLLHSLFLTVFYADALIEMYRSWPPAEYRIDKLYDDVVWACPVRTTPERTRRLAADIQNERLRDEVCTLSEKLKSAEMRCKIAFASRNRIILSILSVLLVWIAATGLAISQHILGVNFHILQTSDFISLLTLVGSVSVVAVGLIWQIGSIRGNRER